MKKKERAEQRKQKCHKDAFYFQHLGETSLYRANLLDSSPVAGGSLTCVTAAYPSVDVTRTSCDLPHVRNATISTLTLSLSFSAGLSRSLANAAHENAANIDV
jgi:hypothetical protein